MLDYTDILFEFFFQVDYPITWIVTSTDSRFAIENTTQADHDSRFSIANAENIDHDTAFEIFAVENIDHDTVFDIQAVSCSDTRFMITACENMDHDTRFSIEGSGIDTDHATFYAIREEDRFTN